MSTRSTIWYGEDDKGRTCHFYWELGKREPELRAPIYLEIEDHGIETIIRLPKEFAQKVREALDPSRSSNFEVM